MGCQASTPLVFEFVKEGQVVKIEDYIRKSNPNMLVKDPKTGDTLLHHAILTETAAHTFMTDFLVTKKGLEVDAQNKMQKTPLHVAAIMGKPAHIRHLLQNGAVPSMQDKLGKIPLHYAAVQTKVNNCLIFGQTYNKKDKAKVDPCLETADKEGNTPFHVSIINGCFENTRALLKMKANVEARNANKRTPLMMACERGDHAVVKMLILMEVDIEVQDANGHKALFFACSQLDSPDHQRCAIEVDNQMKKKAEAQKALQMEGVLALEDEEEIEAAPAAAVKKSTGDTLVIDFKAGEEAQTVTFTSVPLGMGFETEMPLTVSKLIPGAAAEELGVEVGWQFVSIGGESLEGKTKDQCLSLLTKGARNLDETPSAVFEFGVHDPASSKGTLAKYLSRKKVAFMKMPLGFDYTQALPMAVTSVAPGGAAESFGLTVGMHVTAIGLESITGKDNFFQVMETFKKEVSKIKSNVGAGGGTIDAVGVRTHTV